MDIQEEVSSVVEHGFHGSHLYAEVDDASHKVSGFLVWDGFSGLSHTERQEKLWEVLRGRLGERVNQVSTIFTYTPKEYETLSAA